jgi:L-amino acid N-acyltransferase YncA
MSTKRISLFGFSQLRLAQIGAVALCAAFLQSNIPVAQAAADCDRQCLKGLLEQYLTAIEKHDPSSLPLARSVKFTENGEQLHVGEGFWKTAGHAEPYRLYVLDPKGGAAALQTIVKEGDAVAQVLLRLKVEDKKISEIETLVVRKGDQQFFKPEVLPTLSKAFNEPVPAKERNTREELLKAADAYFVAIHSEGTPEYTPAPFGKGMNRYENGVQTTNVPFNGHGPTTAGEQLDKAVFKGVKVMDRRYPVVDEENGTVLGIVTFRGDAPDRKTMLLLSEVFKVSGGELREIRAVMLDRPKDAKTGWN